MAAHRRTTHIAVEFGQLGAIDEIDAPLPLAVRATVQHIIRMAVRVTAKPDVDRTRMRGQVVFERLCLRLIPDEVKVRRSFGGAVWAVVFARSISAVGVLGDAFIVARSHRRLPQHMMMAGYDDFAGGRFDLGFPPSKCFGRDAARRGRAAARPASHRIRQVVAVAHHQEPNVPDLERITLPGAVDRIRSLGGIDARRFRMLADRIGPFAKPPIRLLALTGGRPERRGVVIAGNIVDLFAPVLLQHRVLTDDLASLLILGCIPKARIVAKVQRDIPWDGWPTERTAILRLAERLGERFEVDWRRLEPDQPMLDSFAGSLIGADVAIADNPKIERHGLLMR